jgi:hypothetical protein
VTLNGVIFITWKNPAQGIIIFLKEVSMVLNYFLALTIGGAIGAIIVTLFNLMRTGSGVLKIDRTNPDKELYQIVIDDLDDMRNKKRFMLTIEETDHISHE